MGEVFKPVLTQIAQTHPLRQISLNEAMSCVGHKDLAAVPGGSDTGRAVEVNAHVAGLSTDGLAGVERHPHPQRQAARPRVLGESLLGRHCRDHRIPGSGEHHEKSVALGVDLLPASPVERVTQQPVMLR